MRKKIIHLFPILFAFIVFSCNTEPLEGEFSSTPDGSDPEEFCENATLLIAEAQLALVTATADNADALCQALRGTIENVINVCGDTGGAFQTLLDELGSDCMIETDGNDDDDDGDSDEDSVFFISFMADGELIEMSFDSSSTSADYIPGMSASGVEGCDRDFNYGFVPNSDTVFPQSGIDFYNLFSLNGFCLTMSESEAFNSVFPTGSYAYSNTDAEYGVGFSYATSSDDTFNTLNVSQSGSSFTITSSEENNILIMGVPFNIGQIIEGTFTCTINNTENPTESLSITDGSFRLRVESF